MEKKTTLTTKNKIVKACKEYIKETGSEIVLDDIKEIVEAFQFIEDEVELLLDIELRGDVNGYDFWLQAEYYSKKLQKAIIFDYDWASTFADIEEFADSIVHTENEIIAFEKRIRLMK